MIHSSLFLIYGKLNLSNGQVGCDVLRQRRRERSDREYGLLWLLGTLIVMGVLGAFLADAQGVTFGSIGMLVWMAITAVFFFLGLFYFAQYILPPLERDDWVEGFLLLLRHTTTSSILLFAPPLEPVERPSKADPPPTNQKIPESFASVQAGVVRGHEVLALAKGELFSRADGPGYVPLGRGERILKLIDLRPHTVKQRIKANTRDAIPIEVTISLTMRVRQDAQPASNDVLFPYTDEDIFKVSTYASVDQSGNVQPWTQQLIPNAIALINQELSNYTLDELQQIGLPPLALDNIRQRVVRELKKEADAHGLELQSVGISGLSFPEEVTEQRIKIWQSEWQRKIDARHALGDAEAERRHKQARARAQIEMIERITQSIDAMRRQDNAHLNEIITLRMIEALEEAMTEGNANALIPQHIMSRLVMDASNQMQGWLRQPPDDEFDGGGVG